MKNNHFKILFLAVLTGLQTPHAISKDNYSRLGSTNNLSFRNTAIVSNSNSYNVITRNNLSIASIDETESYLEEYSPDNIRIEKLLPIYLSDIERLVEENNLELKVMRLRTNQSYELLTESLAKWYPSIDLSANGLPQYLQSEQYNNSDFANDTSSRQWKSSISLKIQWDLINPARIPEIEAARDTYDKAKFSYLVTLRDLRLKALNEYFLLQKSDEGVRIGTESMKASLISLRDAKSRFEAGLGTRLEVLEAETQLARDKQLLNRKLGDQSINRRRLAETLNLGEKITPTAASPQQVIGLWTSSLEESISSAYAFREELDELRLDIAINNNNANASLALIQPTISLVNTLTSSYSQGQLLVSSPDMDNYSSTISNTIGLNATWKIFDGGSAQSLYNYNKLKAEESQLLLLSQKGLIRKEVEESFFNLQTANQDIATTSREIIAARESLRLARLRFQSGISTQREVVNNQRDLTEAEVRYSDAISSYNSSLSELQRRTGINHISACGPRSITPQTNNSENIGAESIPIEPYPVLPACKVSDFNLK